MHRLLFGLLIWLVTVGSLLAQGTVNFSNRVIAEGIDAPITDTDGKTRLVGTAFLAQLYAGATASTLVPVGDTQPFRTGTAAGYMDAADPVRVIPTVAPGAAAFVQMRVWAAADGSTFEIAAGKGGRTGSSAVLNITTGGFGNPPSFPANLKGLLPFSLALGTPPKITQQPANVAVNAGQSANFQVVATGTAPLSYLWYKDGGPLLDRTTATLSIPSVKSADAGVYTVVVKNTAGQVTSTKANLTVNSAPEITVQPNSLATKSGSFAQFTVAAIGTAPLAYQWQLNGAPIAGATSPTLTLNSVQTANEGTYAVTVKNALGQAISDGAVLLLDRTGGTVSFANRDLASGIDAPIFDSDGVTRLSGLAFLAQLYAGATLETMAPTGPAVPFRTGIAAGYWLGEPQSTRVVPSVAPGQPAFIQIKVWESSKGKSFEAAASAGSKVGVSSRFQLTTGGAGEPPSFPTSLTGLTSFKLIQGTPPQITTQPASAAANAGSSVTFKVVASGTAPLSYQWKLNGAAIASGTSATLTVNNVQAANEGAYTVDVSNLFGQAASAKAVLTVNRPPAITTQPVSIKVSPGASFSFTVEATGTAPLSYQWKLNGAPIAGATAATLSRPSAQPALEGSYSVVLTNPLGAVSSESAALLIGSSGGTVAFSNRDLNSGIDAKVLNTDGSPLAGEGFLAQLYAGASADQLLPTGPAVTFRTGIAAGYWNLDPEPSRYLQTVPAGSTAFVQARVWEVAKGATFEQALAAGGNIGFSQLLKLTTGGAGSPPQIPVNMIGLTSFKLAPAVAPTITAHPKDLAVDAGAAAAFEVTAIGTAPLSYQWKKDGNVIPNATQARFALAAASALDAGVYSVEVRNPIKTIASTGAKLTVNSAPRITLDPLDTLAALGGAITLKVEAAGSAPLSYQWRFNGVNIAGATGATLTLPNLQAAAEGVYDAVVKNSFGSAISDTAVVALERTGGTLNFANRDLSAGVDAPVTDVDGVTKLAGPAFLAQLWAGAPGADLAPTGPAVPFKRDAGAGYWALNPSPIRSVSSVPAGAPAQVQVRVWEAGKGTTFAEAAANRSKLGFSDIIAVPTGGAGSPPSIPTSLTGLKSFHLVVGEAPKITAQPASLTRKLGEAASFTVAASGSEPLQYQWFFNTKPITGASKAVLTLNAVALADAGSYTVEVRNPLATVRSDAATLTVVSAPVITTQLQDVLAAAGTPVTLSLSASGAAPLAYAWTFNGKPIAGAVGATLDIGSLTSAKAGVYQVTVSNPMGSAASDPAVVMVEESEGGTINFRNRVVGAFDAPVFDQDGTTRLSGPAYLAQLYAGPSAGALVATGPAVPFRTGIAAGYWTTDPTSVRNVAGVAPGAIAQVQVRVWAAAAGTSFEAAAAAGAPTGSSAILSIVTGGAGNPPSLPAELTGLTSFRLQTGVAPSITSQPVSKLAAVGQSVSFSVGVEGTAPISYQWRLNDQPISGATSSTLQIPAVKATDAGNYSVVVKNGVGSVASTAALLTVQENVLAGAVVDGYISRATVFLDANRNGVLDASEPSATTDDQGRYTLAYRLVDFDKNKNGKLDAEEGVIVVSGGVDISTGLPLGSVLQAPATATVVSPLTTLMQKVADQNPALGLAGAESAVKSALSIPASVSLGSFDPINAVTKNDPTAVPVLAAGAKVQDTIIQTAALLDGSTPANFTSIANSANDAIAASISKTAGTLTLSSASTVQEVIQTTAAAQGVKLDATTSSGAAAVIAEGNRLKDEFAQGSSTASAAATEIARVQSITQGVIADRLADVGEGSSTIGDTIATSTGTALVEAVRVAPVGDVTGADVRSGTIGFAQSTFVVDESGRTSAAFTLVRTEGNQGQVSVDIQFKDGTATAASKDYVPTPIHVVFGDGEISKVLNWSAIIVDDTAKEETETFSMTLALSAGNPAGTKLGLNAATVQIQDNDSAGSFGFSAGSVQVSETGTPKTPLLIQRTGGSSGAVTLIVTPKETKNGATAGADFDPTPITIRFADGQTSQVVPLPVKDDSEIEKIESFALVLTLAPTAPASARLAGPQLAEVLIRDDEFLLSKPRFSATGQLSVGGVGEPGRRYQIESSTDLRKWTPVNAKQTDDTGNMEVSDSDGGGVQKFYRARRAD